MWIYTCYCKDVRAALPVCTARGHRRMVRLFQADRTTTVSQITTCYIRVSLNAQHIEPRWAPATEDQMGN